LPGYNLSPVAQANSGVTTLTAGADSEAAGSDPVSVLPAEADPVPARQTTVGDGDAMGISAEILQVPRTVTWRKRNRRHSPFEHFRLGFRDRVSGAVSCW
jgi:hypothetical protein